MEGYANPSNWLGYSYRNFDRDTIVYYLIPFNWIFRICRSIWNWIRYYWQDKDSGFTPERKAYQAGQESMLRLCTPGLKAEYNKGYERGWKEAGDRINEILRMFSSGMSVDEVKEHFAKEPELR
jgi:hypothetical protein